MKTAMILAAGRGERLKPLTNTIPKALCVVHDKPLIVHHIIHLVQAGFERIVINHAYLGGKIRRLVGNGSAFNVEICYSPEPPGGLETGGGLMQALPLLGNKPFLAVNADIFTDYDFSSVSLNLSGLAHLVLTAKNPSLNHPGDFGLNAINQVTNTDKLYTFAGIAVYKPEMFKDSEYGRFSLTPMLKDLVSKGLVSGECYKGKWFDIGSKNAWKP
jgi:MurNAc alpha-1-phosphate uridylyltransferase